MDVGGKYLKTHVPSTVNTVQERYSFSLAKKENKVQGEGFSDGRITS